MARLARRIRERGARIVPGVLPLVGAATADVAAIFELLLSLSLRRAKATPEIWVSASLAPQGWEFALRATGAGQSALDRRSQEEFERCRKLVEKGGGRLWADHGEGFGTTIRFTVPD